VLLSKKIFTLDQKKVDTTDHYLIENTYPINRGNFGDHTILEREMLYFLISGCLFYCPHNLIEIPLVASKIAKN
jgi:hypothetical protein